MSWCQQCLSRRPTCHRCKVPAIASSWWQFGVVRDKLQRHFKSRIATCRSYTVRTQSEKLGMHSLFGLVGVRFEGCNCVTCKSSTNVRWLTWNTATFWGVVKSCNSWGRNPEGTFEGWIIYLIKGYKSWITTPISMYCVRSIALKKIPLFFPRNLQINRVHRVTLIIWCKPRWLLTPKAVKTRSTKLSRLVTPPVWCFLPYCTRPSLESSQILRSHDQEGWRRLLSANLKLGGGFWWRERTQD